MTPNLARPTATTTVLLLSLYCAQGLPSGLIAHSLPALLRENGVDLAAIGLLKLLALPWLLKALWAPWVDRYGMARVGHYRSWILPLQSLVILALLGLALVPSNWLFGQGFALLLALLVLINLCASTQDIATDALAVKLLPERLRGLGNSLQVGGYKLGMLLSGSGLLLLVGSLGWNLSLALLALLLLLVTVPVWLFAERRVLPASVASVPAHPLNLWQAYRGFFLRPGMLLWLLVLVSYKLGDSLGSPMIKPMLVDQGWKSWDLGVLTLYSTLSGIAGAVLAGWLYARFGAWRMLLLAGLLQAGGLAALAWVASHQLSLQWVYCLALFEQLADGMSTVVLFALMMGMCRAGHEGADFTVQASLQLLLLGVVGSFSGVLATMLGYSGLFLWAGVLSLLMLALALAYWRQRQRVLQAEARTSS